MLAKTRANEPSPIVALEALIDLYGLRLVLDTTGFICRLKADHIRSDWQDEALARVWDTAAGAIERAELVLSRKGVAI